MTAVNFFDETLFDCEAAHENCVVFILAHPDDDVFVRPFFQRALARGLRCICFILTDASAQPKRKSELLRAIKKFCAIEDIHFIGEKVSAPDGKSIAHLHDMHNAVSDEMHNLPTVHTIITHAWEMGHPDHDAAHLVALVLANEFNVLNAYSVTYYRAGKRPWLLSVQSPHHSDAFQKKVKLPFSERIDMLLAARFYPSQLKTFIGLLPFMIIKAVFDGYLYIEPLAQSMAPKTPIGSKSGPTMTDVRFNTSPIEISKAGEEFFERIKSG